MKAKDFELGMKQIKQIHYYGGLCFYVFGIIYFFLLNSTFLMSANFLFGTLCFLNLHVVSRFVNEENFVNSFLTIVYLGLVNVIVHIGDTHSPMFFWGLTNLMAAAFMCKRKTFLLWAIAGTLFFPLCYIFKITVAAHRLILLDESQYKFLLFASYFGITFFITFTFYLFHQRLEKNVSSMVNANNELENLVRVICHDISNPVCALQISTQRTEKMLVNGKGTEDAIKQLSYSLGVIDRINALINQVRSISASRANKAEGLEDKSNVQYAWIKAVEGIRHLLEKKNIKLETKNLECANIEIHFNPENLILQIFTNYLTNAIKFSPAGSTITAAFDVDAKNVYVAIEDHGIGIPADILARLGKSSPVNSRQGTDGEVGTGNGLVIAQSYLEKYGACCHYNSVEARVDPTNQGTRVSLRFSRNI